MARRTNLFALTPPGSSYPHYISLNEEDGRLLLAMRGPEESATAERPYACAGMTLEIEIPLDRVADFVRGLLVFTGKDTRQ